MSKNESPIFPRVQAESVHKGCGNVCLVGRVQSYSAKAMKLVLLTNEQQKTTVEVVLREINDDMPIRNGLIVEVRGYGVDNKKLTAKGYTVFGEGGDLRLLAETISMMNKEFKDMFYQ